MTSQILTLLVITGLLLNALRLRSRTPTPLPPTPAHIPGAPTPAHIPGAPTPAHIPGAPTPAHIPGAPTPASPISIFSPTGTSSPSANWTWITARGLPLGQTTRQDALAYAAAERLDLLDLVPADLPATAARDLLRAVDPRRYRSDRLAPARSAGAALLIAQPLLAQSTPHQSTQTTPHQSTPQRASQSTIPDQPADLIATARRIRPCATSPAIAVGPALSAAPDDLAKRRARLQANGVIVPVHLALEAIPYALTVAALLTGWAWGLAALAAYCLQPYLIFAGTALRPRGRHVAALLRPVHTPYVWARTASGRWRSAAQVRRAAEFAQSAAWYRAALADGPGRFQAPLRPHCPWCGSADLAVLRRLPDLVQHKPGLFTLDRCRGCGHVFQNPALTPQGLAFYYRDAYDGIGSAIAENIFRSAGECYRARARLLAPFATPKAWLDVGAGHGHFCAAAQRIWPDTVFEGLDQGAGIEEAQRRGWIATAHRGMFPRLAAELAGRYDVVSMHHYLEHTTDPFAELDAAARVLPPGGHLLIELPDPQWPLSRLLGKYWVPWFQPQHLHMMPLGNLTGALTERGLRPVAVERAAAHQATDFMTAAVLLISRLAPDRALPWSARPPTIASRTWRALAWAAGIPLIGAGQLLDRTVVRALARRWDRGNAYRVLARKEEFADAR
jgi:SAM-dependent methyltransferase